MKYKSPFLFLLLLILASPMKSTAQDLGNKYLAAWKAFYPSRALSQGMHSSVFSFENYSAENIASWLALNKEGLEQLEEPTNRYAKDYPINARLLRLQMRKEIDRWERQASHQHDLTLYTNLLRSAWTNIMRADYLSTPEKAKLLCNRIYKVENMMWAARENLQELNKTDAERGLRALVQLQSYLQETLFQQIENMDFSTSCPDFTYLLQTHIGKLKSLENYLRTERLPNAKEQSPLLGKAEYARQLELYTDGQLTPKVLEQVAREEIEETKRIIQEISKAYLKETYPKENIPESEWTSRAFADMEKDAPKNGAEYKSFWLELADAAVAFIEEQGIATLPKYQTLRIDNAPESAGAAARIGWVDSASPFDPNPVTTLYLPSIPDTLPEQEQIDFWSSFNKPFNRMIVIHELFPGHYMQIKISRETPHPLRLLFPYSPYIEGWATFTEKVLLDAGWEKERKLTYLAHLRKRLENANRAYTSVQVHCNGWTQDQVMQFSTETSLLAPQFAKSLWGRIMRSPMQLTSYFWGGKQFKDLQKREQERLGDRFDLKRFMDTIMLAGPIPIDDFDALFQAMITD